MAAVDRKGVPYYVTPWWHAAMARAIGLALFVVINYILFTWFGWRRFFSFIGAMGGSLAGALFEWHFYGKHLKTIEHRLRASRLALCLRCGYQLHGLPDNHQCPECGEPYTLEDTRQQWWKWVSKRFPTVLHDIECDERHREIMERRKTCIRCGAALPSIGKGICEDCAKITRSIAHEFGMQ